jgi:hypothetical protein
MTYGGNTEPPIGAESHLAQFVFNIKAGLKLAFFLKVSLTEFRISIVQVSILIVVGFVIYCFDEFMFPDNDVPTWQAHFSLISTYTFLGLAAVYVLVFMNSQTWRFAEVFVVFSAAYLCAYPILYGFGYLLDFQESAFEGEDFTAIELASLMTVLVFIVWLVAFTYRIVKISFTTSRLSSWILVTMYLAIIVGGGLIAYSDYFTL